MFLLTFCLASTVALPTTFNKLFEFLEFHYRQLLDRFLLIFLFLVL